jgi:hypothetical protein
MMGPAEYEAEIDRLTSALEWEAKARFAMAELAETLQIDLQVRKLRHDELYAKFCGHIGLVDQARELLDTANNILEKEAVDDRWELCQAIENFLALTD